MLIRMWIKDIDPLLVGVQSCTATMEISVGVPGEEENRLPQDLMIITMT